MHLLPSFLLTPGVAPFSQSQSLTQLLYFSLGDMSPSLQVKSLYVPGCLVGCPFLRWIYRGCKAAQRAPVEGSNMSHSRHSFALTIITPVKAVKELQSVFFKSLPTNIVPSRSPLKDVSTEIQGLDWAVLL